MPPRSCKCILRSLHHKKLLSDKDYNKLKRNLSYDNLNKVKQFCSELSEKCTNKFWNDDYTIGYVEGFLEATRCIVKRVDELLGGGSDGNIVLEESDQEEYEGGA